MNPPENSACWSGEWARPAADIEIWALSAVMRTVAALPEMHPWRLADVRGESRSMVWCAVRPSQPGVAVLTQTAPEPQLEADDQPHRYTLADAILETTINRSMAQPSLAGAIEPWRPPLPGVVRWVGGLTRLAGSWLPRIAILPRALSGLDDPGTEWSTESVDFDQRHSVYADDHRVAADVLAPHVMALILDTVPDNAAVAVAGDALHVWWPQTPENRVVPGSASKTVDAADAIAGAIPSFILADHPDRSGEVERRLAERSSSGAEYRNERRRGRSNDPVLERIYAQAQAEWQAGHGSDAN